MTDRRPGDGQGDAAEARRVRAAGAVLWRAADGPAAQADVVPADRVIAVIHRPRYDDWSLPKGKLDPGEDDETAALREVREETGQGAEIVGDLGEVRYLAEKKGTTIDKVVRYFEMRVVEPGPFAPDDEVDDLRWVPAGEAPALLTYGEDHDVLQRYASGLAAGH